MQFIDKLPLSVLLIFCVLLGLAPFFPEPHIVEKLRLLLQGNLKKPIDIFDLLYHSAPFVLLIIKLIRIKSGANQ